MDEIVAGAILESLTSKALDIAWSRLRKKMDIGAALLNQDGTFSFIKGEFKRWLGIPQAALLQERKKQLQRLFTFYAAEPNKLVLGDAVRVAYAHQQYYIPTLEGSVEPQSLVAHKGEDYKVDEALGIPGYKQAAMRFRKETRPKKTEPFDGSAVRILDWDGVMTFTISEATYFDQYVTNQKEIVDVCLEDIVGDNTISVKPQWFERTLREINASNARLLPFSQSLLANTIGVAATVVTRDGYLVLPRRNQSVHFQSGYEGCSVSGVLEWSPHLLRDFMGTLKYHVAKKEGPEEILLDPSKITICPLGFAREFERAGKPQFFFHIWTEQRLREFVEKWKQSIYPRQEFDSVRWIQLYEREALRQPEGAIQQAVERILALLNANGYIVLKDGYQVVLSEEMRANLFYLALFLQSQQVRAFPSMWVE
ncbi:MAG TPA: hypothetical protein PLM06_02940 [Anaerolineae bacterium]|nr:hypothetical protein [Anaerolineae bacterium]